MKTEISSADIERYRRDGFLKVESFFAPDELSYWRRVINDAAIRREERIPGFNDGGRTGAEYYDAVFRQRVNLWRTDEAVKQLALNQEIASMAAALEGVETMRLWHDQALFKEAWANPTSWHIDDPYWSFYSRHATTIWIALDDATVQNGALYFLPGAHKEASFDNVMIGENIGSLFDVYPDWRSRDPVCVEMKAGDASFHNGLTPHAAGPNMTTGRRRAFAIIYMPDDVKFNGQRNILPQAMFDTLTPGDALDNDDFNPVVTPQAK